MIGSIKKNIPANFSNKKDVFSNINVSKIGTGSHFVTGNFSSSKARGLKGQLGKLKRLGKYTTTANLSKKNLNQIHDLISDRLKNKAVGSKILINAKDKRKIMHEAYKLTKTKGSGFSKEDMKDLEKIVNALKSNSKDRVVKSNKYDNIDKNYLKNEDNKSNIKPSVNNLIYKNDSLRLHSVSTRPHLVNQNKLSAIHDGNDLENSSLHKTKDNNATNQDIPKVSDAKDLPI